MQKKLLRPLTAAIVILCLLVTAVPVFAVELDPFTDVPVGHWAYQPIMNMVRLGIIAGYPDGTFKPDKLVSREEFARILCGATSTPIANPNSNTFADITASDWSFRYVETVKDYLTGYPGTGKPLFKGKQDATREDVAVALVRIKGFDKTAAPNPTILDDMYRDVNSISSNLKNLIAIAVEKKLIAGYPDKTFRGNQTLTRAEAAVLIDKANSIAGDVKDISYYNSAQLLYVTIESDKTTGNVGDKIEAAAKGYYTNGQSRDITTEVSWTSSDSTILSVDNDGDISLLKCGTAKIFAMLDEKADDLEITVSNSGASAPGEIKTIKVTPETKDIKVNDTITMQAQVVYENGSLADITNDARWESTDSNVALVSSQGKVIGLKEGTVLIKASYMDETGYAALTVTGSVYTAPSTPSQTVSLNNISISTRYKEMKKGEKITIKAIGSYSDQSSKDITASVSWSSSNTTIAQVSANGQITAISDGMAIITATKDGESARMFVVVRKKK